MSARYAAYKLIEKVETGGYSNIALGGMFSKSDSLSDRDKAFAARLFYGVTERKLTLEHIIGAYVSKPLQKLDRQVRITLMMGVYQIMYMDNVPDSAAVNESVSLVKKLGKASASGMVNAVLRSIIRDGKKIPPVKGDKYDKMAVEYSCPAELIRRICKGYGEENTVSLLEASLLPSVTVLRTNVLKTSSEELIASLKSRGISAQASEFEENAVICDDLRDVERDPDFIAGNYHVQDYSSQLCCKAVSPRKGETVIDICAAPGGKTFTMAEMMGDEGRIFACELHEKRTGLIVKGAERLGISCIEAVTNDARVYNEKLPVADRVLCDVPCSGYGVIRGKPEIRYKPLSEAQRLPEIQLDILRTACRYVKDGGLLVYSTCTLNPEENGGVVGRFLAENEDFEKCPFEWSGGRCEGELTLFPHLHKTDGFYICKLKRRDKVRG